MQFGIGQAVVRKEDLRLLTGGGRYLDDINLPGQAHAAILRSPHAHARIRSVDSSGALTSPGVIAVFTGADLAADGVAPMPCLAHVPAKPGTPDQVFPRRMALVADRVRHVGDAVALVVAESAAAARDALANIAVDYEPLPAAIDPIAAMQPGAPQIWPEAPGNLDFTWADGGTPRHRLTISGTADTHRVRVARSLALFFSFDLVRARSLETRQVSSVYQCL